MRGEGRAGPGGGRSRDKPGAARGAAEKGYSDDGTAQGRLGRRGRGMMGKRRGGGGPRGRGGEGLAIPSHINQRAPAARCAVLRAPGAGRPLRGLAAWRPGGEHRMGRKPFPVARRRAAVSTILTRVRAATTRPRRPATYQRPHPTPTPLAEAYLPGIITQSAAPGPRADQTMLHAAGNTLAPSYNSLLIFRKPT